MTFCRDVRPAEQLRQGTLSGVVVFEIGSRLREARERQGLTLHAAERATRIRARWLEALEEERFDLLPERVYAIGFLRTYAHYLGLQEQLFVDELSSRLPLEEEHEVHLAPVAAHRKRALAPWILALVGVAVVAAIVVGLIRPGGSARRDVASPAPTVRRAPPKARASPSAPATTPSPQHEAKPRMAKLVLSAANGRCWLDARLGSESGRELHVGTLELGQSLTLRGRRMWIRLGAPRALDVALNGHRIALPATTPVNLVVTAAGVRPAP
jgi:cytoskeleton protein RodZ